ncbi:Ig-like domain-containing protein, partial [Nanoarchaeota archaeon]
MASKIISYGSLVLVILLTTLCLSWQIADQETQHSISSNFNSLAGKITGMSFNILEPGMTITGGAKPIAGFVLKYDDATPAINATVIVYVNISNPAANPCFTLPSVLSSTDGSYTTNLDNLKRADNITQSCDWSVGDTIWAEANGSTVSPFEGSAVSTIITIENGTGLQIINNFSLAKGDTTPPNITLISPANDTTQTFHSTIFQYNVSDNRGVLNCSLYVNDVLDQTDSNITNNTQNNFTKFLVNGDYNWSVLCYDTSENNASATWSLTVAVNNLPPQFVNATDDHSTVSNPTNIGTNVWFSVNATDPNWDNYKLVICNSSSISQNGTCSDTLVCQSSFVATDTVASCYHDTTGETQTNYNWFSFVCDSLNCSGYNNTNSPYYLNYYPYYSTIPDQTWSEDSQHTLNLSNYFTDPESFEINYTASAVQNITVNINNSNKVITFIPDSDWYGTRTISFTGTDPYGLSNTSNSLILNITNINDPPVLENVSNQSTAEDTTPPENWINLHNHTHDSDHNLTELNYTLVSQTNSSLINCALVSNQYINCSTPAPDEFGISYLNISVTDGEYTDFDITNI